MKRSIFTALRPAPGLTTAGKLGALLSAIAGLAVGASTACSGRHVPPASSAAASAAAPRRFARLCREVHRATAGRLTNGSVTLESRMGPDRLCATLLAKIHEQFERTEHLIDVVPADRLNWTPPIPGAWPVGVLLGHLLECFAGFCAVLSAVEPERLAHFEALRALPVNHECSPADALTRQEFLTIAPAAVGTKARYGQDWFEERWSALQLRLF